jgi:DNA-binding IclR family transcriptional regulator
LAWRAKIAMFYTMTRAESTNTTHSKGPELPTGIQSVARAFAILELFNDSRPTLSVSEIASLTGLNRGTAYRFCRTLRELGYLDPIGPRLFRPGLKVLSLSHGALASRDLPDLALPHLRDLQRSTNETVNMALLDGEDVVYVSRVLSDNLLMLRLYVGSRLPAYATSLGRAIMAFLPQDQVNAILDATDLRPFTEHTIVDRGRLLAELDQIRTQGYAVIQQEVVLGLTGIAAPIFGDLHLPVAAINLSVPRLLRPDEISDVLAPRLVATAARISDFAKQLHR